MKEWRNAFIGGWIFCKDQRFFLFSFRKKMMNLENELMKLLMNVESWRIFDNILISESNQSQGLLKNINMLQWIREWMNGWINKWVGGENFGMRVWMNKRIKHKDYWETFSTNTMV